MTRGTDDVAPPTFIILDKQRPVTAMLHSDGSDGPGKLKAGNSVTGRPSSIEPHILRDLGNCICHLKTVKKV